VELCCKGGSADADAINLDTNNMAQEHSKALRTSTLTKGLTCAVHHPLSHHATAASTVIRMNPIINPVFLDEHDSEPLDKKDSVTAQTVAATSMSAMSDLTISMHDQQKVSSFEIDTVTLPMTLPRRFTIDAGRTTDVPEVRRGELSFRGTRDSISAHHQPRPSADNDISIGLSLPSATVGLRANRSLARVGANAGVTTASHFFDRGPYHAANAQFRAQMPHYGVHVSIVRDYPLILITAMSMLALAAHSGVRVWYLVTGRVRDINTSVVYSWIVLAAELAIGVLGFYCRMLTLRQRPHFYPLTASTLERIAKVCCGA
jgi:hypothetical protein